MLSHHIAKLAYGITEPKVLKTVRLLQQNEYRSLDEKIKDQIMLFKKIARYAYENNKYYNRLFDSYGICVAKIKYLEDIEKIPITTKRDILSHYGDFLASPPPYPYIDNHTSGTMGLFFDYRLDKYALMFGRAKIIRGWSYGGYSVGDKIATISPSRIGLLTHIAVKYLFRRVNISVGDMSDGSIQKKIDFLNTWKPKFLRGYVSSIAVISEYILRNNIRLEFVPVSIFTTAEKLNEHQRTLISNAFSSAVYDTYGLYDSGITAFECEYHNGLHVDCENSLLEVVAEDGRAVIEQEGKIIGTDFYNYSFPFIRYDTGDYGILSKKECTCGRTGNRLLAIMGRETDHLELYGQRIRIAHQMMYSCNVKQFQVHQMDSKTVKFIIVKAPAYSFQDERKLRESITTKVDNVAVHFEYVDTIKPYKNNKYKIVIRHTSNE